MDFTAQDEHRDSLTQDTVDAIVQSLSLSGTADSTAFPPDSGAGSPKGESDGKEREGLNDSTQDTRDEPPPDDNWTMSPAELERRLLEQAREAQVSSVSYLTVSPCGEEETHSITTSREQVRYILRYFLHLRAHLRASIRIVDTHRLEDFLQPHLVPGAATGEASEFEVSQMATHQVLFMYHHNAISETLQSVENNLAYSAFGLPSNYAFRGARNTFCHSVLVPGGHIWWAQAVKGARECHGRLLRQVEGTVPLLEGRLADEAAWGEREEEDVVVCWQWPVAAEERGAGGVAGQTSQASTVSLGGAGEAESCERPAQGGRCSEAECGRSHVLDLDEKWVDVRDVEFLYDEEYERLHH